MEAVVIAAKNALALISNYLLSNVGVDQPFNQVWGTNLPSVSKHDLIKRANALLPRIENAAVLGLTPEQTSELSETPHRLQFLLNNILPNIHGPGSSYVVPALQDEFARLERAFPIVGQFAPSPNWEKLAADGFVPREIIQRVRRLQERVEGFTPDVDDLGRKIARITDAYRASEELPETIASLRAAQAEVEASRVQVNSYAGELSTRARESAEALAAIVGLRDASREKYADLEDAYRAASTKGLASSFKQRADTLQFSVQLWVGALAITLITGAIIGYMRFEELQKVLSLQQKPTVIWGNFIFSALSLAPVIWLSWVATKQINQRFKLAEDYSFKATVASAYEAWKSEAKKQDKELEQRLFGTALSRLEEPPIRFIENSNYGSPWHELVSSSAFAEALKKVPELQETVTKIAIGAGGLVAGLASASAKANKTDAPPPSTAEDGGK